MTDNKTAQIVNASPGQLIIITYELIIEALEEAVNQISAEDEKKLERSITKAQRLLRELINALDLSYEISYDLLEMYLYINKVIIKGYISRKEEPLKEAQKLLKTLLYGWEQATVAVVDKREPVIQNAQQIYAGLTYGKGTLNESIVEDKNRGFKA